MLVARLAKMPTSFPLKTLLDYVTFGLEVSKGVSSGGRSSLQTVDGVHRGRVTLHQVGDCAVHQPVAIEHALAGERGRRHFDTVMSAAAVDCGL